jgi:3-methyladenine DNA glycosylase/8-oxoguanine DNA glycosylase
VSRAAIRHLRRADPVLARVIDSVGSYKNTADRQGTHFSALTRAIVFQQLSGKAASTILGRVHALFGNRAPSPAELLDMPIETLRAAGLSTQKVSYVRDLAARVADGRLPVSRLGRLDDQRAIEVLTGVKGIGRWSAQVYLMFRLGRPDVLPDGDLGIQKAIQRAYKLRSLPAPTRVQQIGEPWAPYRSYASWYLWRSLDVS